MNYPGPPEGFLTLPEHARSTRIRALADACGATMTSAGAGQGGSGSSGSSGSSSGSGDGSSGSTTGTGSPGAGGDGSSGSSSNSGDGSSGGTPPSYADVIAALPEEQRTVILGEVAKKNGEARTMRQRARAAENALAQGSSGSSSGSGNGSSNGSNSGGSGSDGSNSGATGQNGATNGTDGGRRSGSQEDNRTHEQLGRARAQVAASKVESIAASAGFADPEDAVALLGNLSDYVDDDFSVDSDAIRSDVDELLTRKPHLKRQEREQQQNGQRRPAPDRSQGSSANGNGQQRSGVDAGRDLYRSRHRRPGGTGATS